MVATWRRLACHETLDTKIDDMIARRQCAAPYPFVRELGLALLLQSGIGPLQPSAYNHGLRCLASHHGAASH